MTVVRAAAGGLLISTLLVLVAGAAARHHVAARAGDPAPAGHAVSAAIFPSGTPTRVASPSPTPVIAAPSPTLPPGVPPPPTPRATDPDLANAAPPLGVPGIKPSWPAAGPDEPTFTENDVRAFIARRGGVFGRRIQTTGPYEIESITFLRGAEVPSRLGVKTGDADDHLLCAATLRGTFTVTGPPSTGGKPFPKTRVILVFDARTGNFLEQIALP